jgi:rhomboid protease GluP
LNNLSRLPVTFGLIGACLAVYLAVAIAGQSYGYPLNVGLVTQPFEVLSRGALVPALVAEGRVWLLFSSMFLHTGFIHLALNMLSLYFLGSFVEVAFGRGRFLALYMTSGLAGGIAYLYFGDFDGSVVGASGAIFGLLGGVLGYSLRRGTFSWQNPLIRQLLILTALNLYFGFSVANISNTAHIGGLLGGLAFGWLVATTANPQKKSRAATPTVIVLGTEVVLLAVWFFVFA